MADEEKELYNNHYLKTTPKEKIEGLKGGIDKALKCDSAFILIIGGKKVKGGFEAHSTSSLAKNLSPFEILQLVATILSRAVIDTAKDQNKRLEK